MSSGESAKEAERPEKHCFLVDRYCPEDGDSYCGPCVAWDNGCKVLKFMDAMVQANQTQAQLPDMIKRLMEQGWANSLGR